MNGDISYKTLYGGGDPLRDLYRHRDKVEVRDNVLPSWWSVCKRIAYKKMARDQRQSATIYATVKKTDVIGHYRFVDADESYSIG